MKAKDILVYWQPIIRWEEKLILKSWQNWVHWSHFKHCFLWGTIEAISIRVCSELKGTVCSTPSSYPNFNTKLTKLSICHRVNNAACPPTSTTTISSTDLLLLINWLLLVLDCCYICMWHISCTSQHLLPHSPIPITPGEAEEALEVFFDFSGASSTAIQVNLLMAKFTHRSLDLELPHWPAIEYQSGLSCFQGDSKPNRSISGDCNCATSLHSLRLGPSLTCCLLQGFWSIVRCSSNDDGMIIRRRTEDQ